MSEPLELHDVVLQALSGPIAEPVRGLTLRLDDDGLHLRDPGGATRSVPWARVADASLEDVTPDDPAASEFVGDAPATQLTAEIGGRRVRWIFPTTELSAADHDLIRARLAAHGVSPAGARAAHGAPMAAPAPAVAPAPTPRPRWLVPVIAVGAVVLVLAVVVIAVVLGRHTTPSPAPSRTAPGGAHPNGLSDDKEVAGAVSLTKGDFPRGWTVDRSGKSPLGAFFGQSGTAAPSPTGSGSNAGAGNGGAQLAACLNAKGLSGTGTFGTRVTPSGTAASPVFVAPGGGQDSLTEAVSETAVYRSASSVAGDMAIARSPAFSDCFGSSLGSLIAQGMRSSAGNGMTIGSPTVTSLSLPRRDGIVAAGTKISIPLGQNGVTVDVELDFVLVGAGRVESAVITFAVPGPFPAGLTSSVTGALEGRMVSESSGSGA